MSERKRPPTLLTQEEQSIERRIEASRRLDMPTPGFLVTCARCDETYRIASGHRGSLYCTMKARQRWLRGRGLETVPFNYVTWMTSLDVPHETHFSHGRRRHEAKSYAGVGELDLRLWVPEEVAKAVGAKREVSRGEYGPLYYLETIDHRKALIAQLVAGNRERWLARGIGAPNDDAPDFAFPPG